MRGADLLVAGVATIEEDFPSLEPSLARVAEDRGIVFVNAGPRLREVHASTLLRVSAEDGHLNAGAHRGLAELIGPALGMLGPTGDQTVRRSPEVPPHPPHGGEAASLR